MVETSLPLEFCEERRLGFPEDMQAIIKGLSHPNRQIILTLLRENHTMSFTDIEKDSKMTSSLLSSHLNQLIDMLLVRRFYDHLDEVRSYSYYEISEVGRRVIDAIESAIYGV